MVLLAGSCEQLLDTLVVLALLLAMGEFPTNFEAIPCVMLDDWTISMNSSQEVRSYPLLSLIHI